MKIILKWRIPSKKNSKQLLQRWWRTMIVSSANYLKWENEQLNYLDTQFLTKINPLWPYRIECIFYMIDKRKTDLSNKFESVADLLVKAKILADDNYEIIPEIILKYWWYDKLNSRVEILINKLENE